jgi:cytoskeletal protein RodZ
MALAGLAVVRVTWITAILVSVLAILSGLLSGTDGRDSSRQLPEFAMFDPAAPVVRGVETASAVPQEDLSQRANRSQRAKQRAPGDSHSDSHSSSGVPHLSGSQPEDAGGRSPVVRSQPNRPQAPSESQPKPPQGPSETQPNRPQAPAVTQPDPPQAPSEPSVPSQPPVSVTVSAPVKTSVTVATAPVQASVAVADNSVVLP